MLNTKRHCIPLRVYGNGVSAPTLLVSVHLKLRGFTEYICTGKSHEIPCDVGDGVRSLNRPEVTIFGRSYSVTNHVGVSYRCRGTGQRVAIKTEYSYT